MFGFFLLIAGALAGPRLAVAAEPPALLSQTGLFNDPSNRRFSPQYPLWTDGAEKSRWIHLPEGSKIDVSDLAAWKFPVGTKFWKEFSFGGHKVETRLIERVDATTWTFVSYHWNDAQTDAELVPEQGMKNVYPIGNGKFHNIPSRADCRVCHVSAKKTQILGFTALQLSDDRDPNAPHADALQPDWITLRTLIAEKKLVPARDELAKSPPRIPTTNPRTRAALGYLAANCGGCHSASGDLSIVGLFLDHSYTAKSEKEEPAFISAVGQQGHYQIPGVGVGGSIRIKPGNSKESSVAYRLGTRDLFTQMPPLGTKCVDQVAVELITQWIDQDL